MVATFSQTQSPTQTHQDEWVLESGVNEKIFQNSIESATDKKGIAKFLEWKGYYHLLGYFIYGIDLQSGKRIIQQFKPDEPHPFPGKEPAKYLTAKSHYDAILLDAPGLDWYKVAEDLSIPLHITEGGKKAGALLTHGYVAIALCGVDMWHLKGSKQNLVPNLDLIEWKGRVVIITFDADSQTNDNVKRNIRELGKELSKRGALVYAVGWELELGKGIDDVLVKHGKQGLEYIMSTKQPYTEWLKNLENQFNTSNSKASPHKPKNQLPSQNELALEIAEKYRERMAWNSPVQAWYQFQEESGIWDEITPETVRRLVATHIQTLSVGPVFSASHVNGTIVLLKAYLEVTQWDEQPGLIPLQDGVLEIATMKLLPHSPGYRLLWQLPYKWADRSAGCGPIQAWINEATQGNGQLIQLLRAYLKAVVTGRADLQRFLELIGNGGSGKGTYTRLAQALVGHNNTAVTTLEQLEKNRFETAAIYGKKLLLITDSDKYGGEVSTLKAITGGDPIRYEKKNVQQCKAFTPTCMVIISANEPPQSTDYTSGLKRRRLTVPFKLQVEPSKRRDLDAEFKPYLPGLLEWVLTLPDEEMKSLIVNTSESVFSARNWEIEMLLDTNPIAQWFDHSVVLVSGEKTYVGLKTQNSEHYLYASYCEYMEGSGQRSCALNRFSRLLQDLTVNQLKLKLIQKGSDRGGTYFPNIALRSGRYVALPRPITGDLDIPPDDTPPPSPPDDPLGDVSVTYEVRYKTLTSNECDVCDVSFSTEPEVEKTNENEIFFTASIEAECENSGSDASPCVTIESGTGFQPQQPSVTDASPASHTSPEASLQPETPKTVAPSTDLWNAPDYDQFPDSNPKALWAMKRDKANRAKHLILAITNEADYQALRNHPSFTCDELNWVRRNLLTSEQRAAFIAAVTQSPKRCDRTS
jgi:putative DNA primase/helicase